MSIWQTSRATLVLILLLTAASFGVSGQQMQIDPVAQVSWQDLENMEARAPLAKTAEVQEVKPLLLMPAPREVGGPLGKLGSAGSLGTEQFLSPMQVPPVVRNFQALPDNLHVIPPDSHGAVSLNRVMTMLNSQIRVQDKFGNILSTISYPTFWSPTGSTNVSDPHVLYDPSVNRWYASSIADFQTVNSAVVMAVSDSANPMGTWKFYRIPADTSHISWADYPDIGYNGTWIAITANMFKVTGNTFSGTSMWVIEKSTALAGGPLTFTSFPVGSDNFGNVGSGFALRVCQTFGNEPTLYLVDNAGFTSGGVALLRLTQITGTGPAPVWAAVPGSTIGGSGLFSVAHNFSNNQPDAKQQGTATLVSTNDSRMLNAVFRNGRIWCTHSAGLPVNSPNHVSVFWYELDPATLPNPIVQSGVVDMGTNDFLFFPSIAVNSGNDVFLGFSHSNPNIFVEAAYTGRRSTDPIGTTSTVATIKAGEGIYTKTFGGTEVRWGDFSATVVDPKDSTSFWTIQEYAATPVGPNPADTRWGTWWGTTLVEFTCGDANGDGGVDIADVVYLINYIFAGGPAPVTATAGDPNCDKSIDIADAVYLIQYIFGGGPVPCAACPPV